MTKIIKGVYYPPKKNEDSFHCPHCGVFSHQDWGACSVHMNIAGSADSPVEASLCDHCEKISYWLEDKMLFPQTSTADPPSPDLPDDCRADYLEAQSIVNLSPKGAAALLRLCIQKLMKHLGKSGKNINNDIAELVKNGLSSMIQQSLDICRVVGNNAVHPGEINIDDDPDIAHSLFRLINIIVDDRITRPKEIEALYQTLPGGALDAIEKRDKT